MNIIYKQPTKDNNSSLSRFDVQNCYFKKLSVNHDRSTITKKPHHHTGFEMHIVTEGYQEYKVDGTTYKLESGSFLLIYPNVEHTVIASTPHTEKFSITFNKATDKHTRCFFASLSDRMLDSLMFAFSETALKKEISAILIENCILEILVSAFRLSGVKENENTQKQDENALILLAKQYIKDNIDTSPSVADVSQYCYLSTKQLTRIFHKFEGVSPKEYIIKKRVAKIEKLLSQQTLSLKEISEAMSFDNEYYFNAFFKKYAGMPPGEYRKMLGQ